MKVLGGMRTSALASPSAICRGPRRLRERAGLWYTFSVIGNDVRRNAAGSFAYVGMSEQKRKMIDYMVVCVNDYADRHGFAFADSFDYLRTHKGLEFLEECYDAEHTLSLDDALEDLENVCKRNEGILA